MLSQIKGFRTLASDAIQSTLVILRNKYSKNFNIDNDILTYKNTESRRTMICFSTILVNPDKFEFSVSTVDKSEYYLVGVIGEKNARRRTSRNCERIFYHPLGAIKKNNENSENNPQVGD